MLPGEHVGRGLTTEKPLPAKPPHQPQPYLLGDFREVCRGQRPSRVKRHAAAIGGPLEHSVGHAGMQMHKLVERGAKPVLERDRTQPRAGLSRRVTSSWQIRRMTKQPFDLLLRKIVDSSSFVLSPVGHRYSGFVRVD